ncbi:unnamed protein product [Enterobius vermicularis]|uniref:Neur_chan_LBD domain-containing protein n=1 Tax=Enterobius vermicularis TaxID=51028 RepID=A0A0N4V0V5_ENTVE|nr:unnamed protein product [Enterobius vermicularis]
MKLLSSACNDTEEVIYNPGSWNEHYTSETWLCTKETNITSVYNFVEMNDMYNVTLWLQGEEWLNIVHVFVYSENNVVKAEAVMQTVTVIHFCTPAVAVRDSFEVLDAYSVRNVSKAENSSLPLQTFA